jgi:hypothetical protein
MNIVKKVFFLACLVGCSLHADEEPLKTVNIQIKLLCPNSDELENLRNVIPENTGSQVSYEEFSHSLKINLAQLIELIESGKVRDSFWSIAIEDLKAEL